MKTVFFESLLYKLITKNDFYYGYCPDIRIQYTYTMLPLLCIYNIIEGALHLIYKINC